MGKYTNRPIAWDVWERLTGKAELQNHPPMESVIPPMDSYARPRIHTLKQGQNPRDGQWVGWMWLGCFVYTMGTTPNNLQCLELFYGKLPGFLGGQNLYFSWFWGAHGILKEIYDNITL